MLCKFKKLAFNFQIVRKKMEILKNIGQPFFCQGLPDHKILRELELWKTLEYPS